MIVEIRHETKTDIADIYETIKIAFGRDTEAKLIDRLRHSSCFIPELSLVATFDNKIVGHILFTKIKIRDDNGNNYDSLALAPLGIKPNMQRQGIGKQLIHYGLNKAKELGHKSVIVLGHEHYYTKFGFVAAVKWKLRAPFQVHPNHFMAIELVKEGLKNISGTVQYPKEFETV